MQPFKGSQKLKKFPAGYPKADHLILCGMNTHIYITRDNLDPMQVYKESLLFSGWCIISSVVLLIFVYYIHALKFLESSYLLDLVLVYR